MNKAFANLVTVYDIDTVTATRFTATNAARQMGLLETTGSIEVGKAADLAVLDNDFRCIATWYSL